jgi:hypothetical protein
MGAREMLGFEKRRPPILPAFQHADGCKIMKADPTTEIRWSEIRRGVWEAICVCGKQYHYESIADARSRQDPYHPSTFRHFGQCEHRDTTDPVLVRAILKIQERDGYWWVQCGACDGGWQVPFYAVESVG